MIEQIRELPFDQLRDLHRQIGALIAERRHEALEELRSKATLLGFTAGDLAPDKQRRAASPKYRDGNGNTWTGRGRKPQWVQVLEAAGEDIERYRA
jgi:DNA-binding protein H-NS